MTHAFMAEVKYQIAIHTGTLTVRCKIEDTDDQIISNAKDILNRRIKTIPGNYDFFKVINRYEV